jgi:hypothetical protein
MILFCFVVLFCLCFFFYWLGIILAFVYGLHVALMALHWSFHVVCFSCAISILTLLLFFSRYCCSSFCSSHISALLFSHCYLSSSHVIALLFSYYYLCFSYLSFCALFMLLIFLFSHCYFSSYHDVASLFLWRYFYFLMLLLLLLFSHYCLTLFIMLLLFYLHCCFIIFMLLPLLFMHYCFVLIKH